MKRIAFLLIVAILVFAPFDNSVVVEIRAQKAPDLGRIFAERSGRKGKRPLIIIPGVLGSELVNKETGEKVWFRLGRSKDDDIRLPVALDLRLGRDKLVPGDVVRKLDIPVLRDVKIYEPLVDALERYGGYELASWEKPPESLEDRYFLFPYDWRRDNIENAQLLFRKVERAKSLAGSDDLKFDVLAHSMGGLIARYAAMYGDKDVGDDPPVPDWKGARHFKRIFLVGTPNLGSARAFETLLEGYGTIGSFNLPFVRDLSPVELITMPSIFQLLPVPGSYQFYDDELRPIDIDIYDVGVWRRYSWSVFGEKNLLESFSEAEIGRMEEYVEIALARSRNLHRALRAGLDPEGGVEFYALGSDCFDTLDGFVIYRDKRKNRWVTILRPKSFRNSKGRRITSAMLKSLLLKPGDGRVTRRSLFGDLHHSEIGVSGSYLLCEEHEKLTGNPFVQNNFLTALTARYRQVP